MPADCCGGKFDVFLQSYIHKPGCPKRAGAERGAAEERLAEGRRDAFKPSVSFDPSYRLGKELEEQKRIDWITENVFGFPVGGRRRR